MEMGAARRVCYEQMKAIMDFMGQHVDFAMGVLRTTEARHKSKKLWSELAKTVNGIRGGTKKTPDNWSRYWSDFKNKLKKKVKVLNRKKRLGSYNTDKEGKPLTKLEKRALVILGPKFAKISNRDEASHTYSKHLPAEVKVEDYQDNGDFCKEPSESSDRLSIDGDRDGDSEGSSAEENGDDDTEQSVNDSTLSNIYPKWLVEVEKKRADAELIRARAEEQRATVAVKSADAAVIQAEALKKLSNAATAQADALMRIALYLESRGHNSQHLLPI